MATAQDKLCRPGLALGTYPERKSTRSDRLEKLLQRGVSSLISKWHACNSKQENVISRINRSGEKLESLSSDELKDRVSDLRKKLVYEGLNDELSIATFALVREISSRVLQLRHYDCQLLAGWAMHNGKLAEMQTGEGKTLAATLPAAVAALAGIPVHIITANDYLANRDATLMHPLYKALGLSVGVVGESLDLNARRAAYASDITYTTHKQVCFDYLRDRVERGQSNSQIQLQLDRLQAKKPLDQRLMLRGLCFAIVDEADSVLIDEARTPLLLSRNLSQEQCNRSSYEQALKLAGQLSISNDYEVQFDNRQVRFTPSGLEKLASLVTDHNPVWQSSRRREELVHQALCALHLYIRDRDYVLSDGQIQIVDQNTGRLVPDQSWGKGLHHMIETKERCELSHETQTLARISYQNFFKRYLKLSGMSGTVQEIKNELDKTYGLDVACIAPHRDCIRIAKPEQFFLNRDAALNAVVTSACDEADSGRAVLIGTRSVKASQDIAQLLIDRGVEPSVLNANQDRDEAIVVAQAGESERITVATNMAGRGTDIQLSNVVKRQGGLHVIIAERNDASRIDRQLVGRCARQGEPGSYQRFVSLEDEVAQKGYSARTLRILKASIRRTASTQINRFGCCVLFMAQRRIELRHRRTRQLVEYEDNRLNEIMSFAGAPE
jgi:preprotein translocase subunit SecA